MRDWLYFVWAIPLVVAATVSKGSPSSRWASAMGHPGAPSDREKAATPISLEDNDIESVIGRAVERAARYTPGEHLCLAQSIAGQRMLAARGIPGTVIVGLRDSGTEEPWEAHAWLIGTRGIVIGGSVSSGFVPVTAYRREVPGGSISG